MPEMQNVWGESWHREFNSFLSTVLGWHQLGVSSTDVINPLTGKPRGIDSVFSYKRNPNSYQQVILGEAKRISNIHTVSKSRLEDWIANLLVKVEGLPLSKEFRDKYRPESGARYQTGLIGLWMEQYDSEAEIRLRNWMAQLHLPERRIPYHITFASNQIINRFLAIHEEVQRLKHSGSFRSIDYFVPDYGILHRCDGRCLPIETLFSKFIFCNARKVQNLKGVSNQSHEYETKLLFYLDRVTSYEDLHFIGLAIRYFQITSTHELTIYTLHKPTEIRDFVATFRSEFSRNYGMNDIQFETLVPKEQIPSWMNTE